MTREVEARLRISAVDRTGAVLRNVGNKLQQVNRRVEALNRAQNSALMMMSRYVAPAALVYGVKEAVTQFAELERRMTRIGITAGVTREQTEAATAELRKLAGELALPFDEVVKGLDTLVSSGLSLQEAMAFLPSVLKTAQATGSATEDIANTALKASSALKITAAEMDKAFDIMVAGGKAGQFELKDMAQYIPGLANSFATLGYQGEDGLKRLIAVLQTIREDTGDASAAATQAQNIFGKMYSEETANKFKKFGIDLRKEMEEARAAGKDALSAFVDLSKEAIKGDLSKLPLLFSDQEFRLGMQSLITSPESLKKFLDLLNGADVKGTVLRDLGTVLDDTQAKIDRMSNSWSSFVTKLGEASSDVVSPVLETGTQFLDDQLAESAGLKKFRKGNPELEENTINEFYSRAASKKLVSGNLLSRNWQTHDLLEKAFQALGRGETTGLLEFLDRESQRTDSMGVLREQYEQYRHGRGNPDPLGVVSDTGQVPVPFFRPTSEAMEAERMADAYRHGTGREDIAAATRKLEVETVARSIRRRDARRFDIRRNDLMDAKGDDVRGRFSLIEAMRMDMPYGKKNDDASPDFGDALKELSALSQKLDEGGQKVSQGGDEAARALVEAGRQVAQMLTAAANSLANIKVNVSTTGSRPGVNVNTGKNNTFALDRSNRRSE